MTTNGYGLFGQIEHRPPPPNKILYSILVLRSQLMFTFESTHHPRGGALCTFGVSEQRAVLSNAVGYQEPASAQ